MEIKIEEIKETYKLWGEFVYHCPWSRCDDESGIECTDTMNESRICGFTLCPLQSRFKKIHNLT